MENAKKLTCSYACIILEIEQLISWIDNNLALNRINVLFIINIIN